jgi:DNA-binding HxlR family transcriptional regulator
MAAPSDFCPRYHHAVELVGRRWAGAIVRALLAGPRRFNELRAAIPDISDRMLAERLRELEVEDVLTRTVLPETPVRVEYALTDKGRALESAVLAIGAWAERWVSLDDVRRRAEEKGRAPGALAAEPEPAGRG